MIKILVQAYHWLPKVNIIKIKESKKDIIMD